MKTFFEKIHECASANFCAVCGERECAEIVGFQRGVKLDSYRGELWCDDCIEDVEFAEHCEEAQQ